MSRQTLIVTIDMSGTTEVQLMEILNYLFATPECKGRLKYNRVDIAQEDVIAAEHALIDIVYRARKES